MSKHIYERPTNRDRNQWKLFWLSTEFPWRSEPEILENRQSELLHQIESSNLQPNVTQYPFQKFRLFRDDLEWLIATHIEGKKHGTARFWDDEGLDLRGAIVKGLLAALPLERMQGGIVSGDHSSLDKQHAAAVNFEDANLSRARLADATLCGARMKGVTLDHADLTGVNLSQACLDGANISYTKFTGASMVGVSLIDADIIKSDLTDATLTNAHLDYARFSKTHLDRAILTNKNPIYKTKFCDSWLLEADLSFLVMKGVDLSMAHLEGAILSEAFLDCIQGDENGQTKLIGTYFNASTRLDKVRFGDWKSGFAMLVNVQWQGADLGQIHWESQKKPIIVGEEYKALNSSLPFNGRRELFENAVRANHQLSSALQNQGISISADYFAYRALVCQRKALYLQGRLLRYWGSKFLDVLAGYGYHPGNTFGWYVLILAVFTGLFWVFGGYDHGSHFNWYDALIYSVASFHGRGFFPGQGNFAVSAIAAFEAVIGLFIEATFIATFAQRYFGK